MLVEPMDPGAFQALYEEYRERHGCSIDLGTFVGLVGASPGYLVDLCPRGRDLLREWLRGELHRLDHALDLAAEAAGLDRGEAMRVAARLLGGEPAGSPVERKLGERLVEANIAYPCPGWPRLYLPQLPLYAAALKVAVEAGLADVSQLALGGLQTSQAQTLPHNTVEAAPRGRPGKPREKGEAR